MHKKNIVVLALLVCNTAAIAQVDDCVPNFLAAQNEAIQNRMTAIDNFQPFQNVAMNRQIMQECMATLNTLEVGLIQLAGWTNINAWTSNVIKSMEEKTCGAAIAKFNQTVNQIQQTATGAINGAIYQATGGLNNVTGGLANSITQGTGGFINGNSIIPNASSLTGAASGYLQNSMPSLDAITNSLAPSVAQPVVTPAP